MSVNEKQRNKYVTFKSGNEYFGLKIEYVNEIIVYQEITEIPAGGSMRGVVIEFKTGFEIPSYYCLEVSPDSSYVIYEGVGGESYGIAEFSCPIALVLEGDISLKSVRLK